MKYLWQEQKNLGFKYSFNELAAEKAFRHYFEHNQNKKNLFQDEWGAILGIVCFLASLYLALSI